MRYLYIFLLLFCATITSFANEQKAQNFVLSVNPEIVEADIVNSIIHSEIFWQYGITGQNTKIANIELGVYNPEREYLKDTIKGEVYVPTGADVTTLYDDHATATAQILSGYNTDYPNDLAYYASLGIAPSAELSAGAVARQINDDGTADVSLGDFYDVYSHFFGVSDVINSSWGPQHSIPNHHYANILDVLTNRNTNTLVVIASGNSGENGENTVQAMAQAFNALTVGALGNANNFDTIASFSSRSPSNFHNPIDGTTVNSVRPAVDIVAPGESIITNVIQSPENPDEYFVNFASGTSFSAPVVSGVVSLMKSASYALEENYDETYKDFFTNLRDNRVVKAMLLNSATKPNDWSNNQILSSYTTTVDMQGFSYTGTFNDVIVTTQGLDFTYGAGAVNAEGALKHIMNLTQSMGWALDTVEAGKSLWYNLGLVEAENFLTATLVWNTNSEIVELTEDEVKLDNLYFSNLGLELWTVIDGSHNLVAVSDTEYNNVEHLYLKLATEGEYLLRVTFFSMAYGDMPESETYAIAFSVVPEPATIAMLVGLIALLVASRRKFKQRV